MNSLSLTVRSPAWRHGFIRAALLAGLAATLPASLPAGAYTLVDLGVDVSPTDINNAGTIVGSRKTDAGSVAVIGSGEAGLVDMPGARVAYAVNDAGQAAGTTLTGAFLYDGGSLTSLIEWDGYGAYGLNESGQISGNKQLKNPYRATPLPLDPAVYTPNKWDNLGIATVYSRGTRQGVYADLYVLNDINDAGFTVGSRRRYGLAGSSAILTTPAFDGVTYLSFPNGGVANAINNGNMIVATSGSNSSLGEYSHAYLLDYGTGSFEDLGTLNGGLTSSAADINDLDQVVGSSWLVTQLTSLYNPSDYHAFLWQDGEMTDLNDLVDTSSGWILTAATAINDNGDIVGTGLSPIDGQAHGFLLTNGAAPPPLGNGNEPPVAVASANPTSGKAPLTVDFSATGSYDPEGGAVTYAWDFGDGEGTGAGVDVQYEFTVPGTYVVVVTVTDDSGKTDTAPVEVKVRGGGKKR